MKAGPSDDFGDLVASRGDRQIAITAEAIAAFGAHALEIARANAEDSPLVVRRDLYALTLHLHTADPIYAGLVSTRIVTQASPGLRTECHVVVAAPGDAYIPPPPIIGTEDFRPRQFETALAGQPFRVWYAHDQRLWQIFDLASNFGFQWMRKVGGYPPWEASAPLRVFLHWFYSARGMRLCHAGTLGRNGRGVLVAGKGGSGKSGTVIGGLCHGLTTVGDDYVVVGSRDGRTIAYPVFTTLKQDPAGLRRLGLDALAAGVAPNWHGKCEFSSNEIAGAGMPEELSIDAILVPRITGGGETRIAPAPRRLAMLALAPSGLFQVPGERDSGVAFFANLVRDLPCFEIALGRDAGEISAAIAAFLDRLGS